MFTSKVTIAIAVYNVEHYIKKSVLSALDQDYPNLEILVVDDCGSDRSIDLVKDLQSCHHRGYILKIIKHPHNIGTGGARNSGIDNATGDYIFFLDGDDYLPQNAISILMTRMKQTNVDFVMGAHARVKVDGTLIDKSDVKEIVCRSNFAIADWMDYHNRKFYCFLWNKLFRLSFLKSSGIRCVPFHRNEDPWFALQLCFAATSISCVSDVTLYYVDRNNSCMYQVIGDFHFVQYSDILHLFHDRMKEKLVSYNSIPHSIISFFNFFWFAFTDQIMYSELSVSKKKEFLEISSSIRDIGLLLKDMDGIMQKSIYVSFKFANKYVLYRLISSLIIYLAKLKRLMNLNL